MTLSIARNPLIEVSIALYSKDEASVQKSMIDIPEHTKHKIYERLWQVMDSPSVDKYGEKAFWGLDTPVQKKIEAVEKVITEDAEPIPVPVKLPRPKNSVEVKMQASWDTGFDPRFTIDGHFLIVPQRSLRQVVSAIVGFVAYCIFVIKSYCSYSREERNVRKEILTAASLERVWSSYYVRALVNNMDDPCLHWIPLAEHDFLEAASYLYRRLNPSSSYAVRLFPREVLLPIHCMNKPQDPNWTIDKIQPGLENLDLAKTGISFYRLSKGAYTLELQGEQKHSFDTLEYDYVPHYLFIHVTQPSAEALKLACRDLRQQIAGTTTDFKCAFSFAQCKAKLKPAFTRFSQAWQEYVHAHELLAEAQEVLCRQDYYAEEYQAFRAEAKMPPAEFAIYKHDKDNMRAKHAYDRAQEALAKDYRELHVETKTGHLLKALHGKSATLLPKV
jgi:hypothetical protein